MPVLSPGSPTPGPSFPGDWRSQANAMQGGVREMQQSGLSPSAAPTSGLPPTQGWIGGNNFSPNQNFTGGMNAPVMGYPQQGWSPSYIGGSFGGNAPQMYHWSDNAGVYSGYHIQDPQNRINFLNPLGNFGGGQFGQHGYFGPLGVLGGIFGQHKHSAPVGVDPAYSQDWGPRQPASPSALYGGLQSPPPSSYLGSYSNY